MLVHKKTENPNKTETDTNIFITIFHFSHKILNHSEIYIGVLLDIKFEITFRDRTCNFSMP